MSFQATEKPLTNAVVYPIGHDGNAFGILGRVSNAIKKSDKPKLAAFFMEEATSGDYDHLIRTVAKYATVGDLNSDPEF